MLVQFAQEERSAFAALGGGESVESVQPLAGLGRVLIRRADAPGGGEMFTSEAGTGPMLMSVAVRSSTGVASPFA